MENQLQTIIIDGQEYDLSMFSAPVQRLTQIIMTWERELQDQRVAAAKTEAALREANREITELIKKELNKTEGEVPAPAESV